MIAIDIETRDVRGTWTVWQRLTDHDQNVTISGNTYSYGWIASSGIGTMSNSADFSRAQGNVCTAPEWSLSLADWTGSERISSEWFDGTENFYGAAITVHTSRDGSTWSAGPTRFWRVTGVDTDGDAVSLSLMAAWGLDNSLIGLGSGDAAVGLCVGVHDLYVDGVTIDDAEDVVRHIDSAHFVGTPGGFNDFAGIESAYATERLSLVSVPATPTTPAVYEYFYIFHAAFYSELFDFRDAANSGILVGSIYATEPIATQVSVFGGYKVYVQVDKDFYESETDVTKVKLQKRNKFVSVCYGAAALSGIVSNGSALIPTTDQVIDSGSGLLKFSPKFFSPNGFLAFTPVLSQAQFGGEYRTGAYYSYYGNSGNILTDIGTPDAFGAYDSSTLEPTGDQTFTKYHIGPIGYNGLFSMYSGVSVADSEKFSAWMCDTQWQVVWRNESSTFPTLSINYRRPFTTSGTISSGSIAEGETEVISVNLQGPDAYGPLTRFSSLEDMNNAGGFNTITSASVAGNVYVNAQITAMIVYGISEITPGDVTAIVTPGPSTYANSEDGLVEAATSILESIAGTAPSVSLADNAPAASFQGEFLAPDTKRIDAVATMAGEMWAALSPFSDGLDISGLPELIVTPSIPSGSIEDVITEPTIEYAYVNGQATKTAYIANVDQDWSWARADEFRGGWGSRDSGGYSVDLGREIWLRCRAAYLRHGIKRSGTISMPGFHEAEAVGRAWFDMSRNGVRRIDWLANPPRFAKVSVVEEPGASVWAGSAVQIPTFMGDCAGYAFPADPLLCTDVSRDITDMTAQITVMLPPVIPSATNDRIIQTLDATDRIVQTLTAPNTIVQELT